MRKYSNSWIWNDIGRNCLLGQRKKLAKFFNEDFYLPLYLPLWCLPEATEIVRSSSPCSPVHTSPLRRWAKYSRRYSSPTVHTSRANGCANNAGRGLHVCMYTSKYVKQIIRLTKNRRIRKFPHWSFEAVFLFHNQKISNN